MRKTFKAAILTLLLTLSANVAFAQHCPFDGGSLIVVHLTDGKNQPILSPGNLTLQEIENPQADTCSYAKGLLSKSFRSVDTALNGGDSSSYYYKNWQTRYCEGCTFLGDGYYAVKLNQAESSCMMKNSEGDFSYKDRKFEISYGDGNQSWLAKVSSENIYSLCTGSGKWSRIVPLEIGGEKDLLK